MLKPEPGSFQIEDIKYQIERGEMKIPQFQRDFVWSKVESSKLMDSIIKGYPIGTFTFWKTKDRLRTVKNVGALQLPDSPPNDYVNYVLDGQQRITSIYACLKGVTIGAEDYSKMYINLKATEEEDIIIVETGELDEDEYISLQDILEGSMAAIYPRYSGNSHSLDKISEYQRKLNSYSFSKIELMDASLEIATEVFTRINTTGKSLNVFEIMCAKTYDEERDFDLFEKRRNQLEKWEGASYETVPHTTILQAIALCLCKNCRRKDILSLDKNDFIDAWDIVDEAFTKTIDYFKNYYGIPVSKLLPYDAMFVPYVYYFYHCKRNPVGEMAQFLQDYFWRCVLGKRFTEGLEGKLATDVVNVIDPIIEGKRPSDKCLESIDISRDSIQQNGIFSLSSAYVKGLVCILTAQHPKSFLDGTEVTIDNSWLSQGNSKNYHHFFPKAYMKKYHHLIDENLVNHIVNITIVDGYLNKNVIKDKAPSIYMSEFREKNGNLAAVMDTHLIDDLDSFGIWNDDYNLFFDKRIENLKNKIKEKIIPKPFDIL